jgi:iron complex transport system substrate-binding protein
VHLRPPSLRRARRTRGAAVGALALLAGLALAACGSDDADTSTGDAGSSGDGGDAAAADAFPVTIEHAFGSTEIPEEPQRVVTWGWGSTDAVLALGEVPVGMPAFSYGADENGLMPWVAEDLEEKGVDTPALLTEGEEPPLGEILELEPDLILAHYSGITEKQYEDLSEIAPTVAYPEAPWSTPWREVVETTGTALGQEDEAEQVLADIDAEVAAAAEEHPEFEGKTIAATAFDPTTNYVYTVDDPRVEFLTDLGFENAPSVTDLYNGDISFYFTLSSEQLDQLTSDVLLVYHDSEEAQAEFADRPGVDTMEQVQQDRVAEVTGQDVVSSVSPPTALSLTYSLDEYVDALSEAASNVG